MFGLGGGTEYSLTLTETDDISTGMFMVYGSHNYIRNVDNNNAKNYSNDNKNSQQ